MAEPKGPGDKSIEMRLAEIEDKLSQLHITEEEMRAYNKVSGLLGAQQGAPQLTPDPNVCVVGPGVVPRGINRFINRGITPRINRFVCECFECQCGPCACVQGGGGGFGGGFGGFGF
ncbi:MAG TPA: hypothetical protein VFL57_01015 [Bryobacteraceae bacterium]|nr:hypothetical protein [Bryobacteraceae bacterium]